MDNLAVAASDFDPFSVTAPSDPRLPGGGNFVVSGLYNVKQREGWSNEQLHDVVEQLRFADVDVQRHAA